MKNHPISFRDPTYGDIEAVVAERLNVPLHLLEGVRTKGERSNSDQVSSAGARTVYQIIPATRKAAIEKWGIDPYLSPQNAAEVAARLLRDSLARNKGDEALAVAEYHGGTNREAWGSKTRAYVARVTGTTGQASRIPSGAPIPQQVIDNYNNPDSDMTPAQRVKIDAALKKGQLSLPRGEALSPPGAQFLKQMGLDPGEDTSRLSGVSPDNVGVVPSAVIERFNNHSNMTDAQRDVIERNVANGNLRVPRGVTLKRPDPRTLADYAGIGGRAVMTGAGKLADFARPLAGPAAAWREGPDAKIFFGDEMTGKANTGADAIGLAKPGTPGELLATAGIEGVTQGLLTGPLGAGGTASGLARSLAVEGLSGGASGLAAESAAQADAPPAVQFLAALAAGVPTAAGVDRALTAPGSQAARVPESMVAQTGEQLPSPPRTTTEARAARILQSRATDPAAATRALEENAQLVPGSAPTTFQQSGDMGLGALEREVATRNPEAFRARSAEQNAARVESLQSIQQGADPNDVATTLRSQLDDIDSQTEGRVAVAQREAQERAAAMGPETTPDGAGEAVRASVLEAEEAARGAERRLWQAVDPERSLTANVAETKQAAREIVDSLPPTVRAPEGEEAAILSATTKMQPLSPLQDLISLRGRVLEAMRAELRTNGSTQAYARLTRLRGAIQSNLANSIAHQVAIDDVAVARGILSEGETTLARLQEEVSEFYGRRAEARGAVGSGSGGLSAGRSSGPAGVPGAESQATRGLGRPAGDTGLPPEQPTVDAGAVERLKAATAATRQRAEAFGSNPVSSVLASAGNKGQYRLSDGQVPSKFFHPGNSGFDDMQALLKVQPAALPIIERYAAESLRKAAGRTDGTIDPGKFEAWRKSHAPALRALPDHTKDRFRSAAAASETVIAEQGARVAALKDVERGAIGKVMKLTEAEDVTRTVGRMLNGNTAVADMRELARATAGNPQARAGLRQAVADHITQTFLASAEAGTSGVAALKADAFQTFFRKNRGALSLIFKSEEVGLMEAIASDLQRANRSNTAVKLPGSNTAQDILGVTKGRMEVSRSLLDGLLALTGGVTGGPIGAAVGVVGSRLIQGFKANAISRVDELVTIAMLNPAVARALLVKAPSPNPQNTQKLAGSLLHVSRVSVLRASKAAALASQDDDAPPSGGSTPRR